MTQPFVNYGRIGSSSAYLIAKCDCFGNPLIYYSGYYNARRGTFKCYPKSVAVPGSYSFEPFEINLFDTIRKY